VELTDREQEQLEALDGQSQMVRDRVRGVAEGWSTGFYLYGEGGIGKSYTVLDELETLGVDYRLTNTRLTPKGLFELLEDYPDKVHVLEDVENLCQNTTAASVLRSALWSNHAERVITWRVAGEKREVHFTGALVFTMNRALDDLPEMRAVKTRIPYLHYQPTNDMIAALMKRIALGGYRHERGELTPEDCLEVYHHVLAKCNEAGRNYDLRMLVNGFLDRLQHEAGHSENDWRDLVESRMKERVVVTVTRRGRIEEERRVAREIDAMPIGGAQKLKLWTERTGKTKSAYYRRLSGS
jgi:hypothetical protein